MRALSLRGRGARVRGPGYTGPGRLQAKDDVIEMVNGEAVPRGKLPRDMLSAVPEALHKQDIIHADALIMLARARAELQV